jgi:hypothetical protein
MIFDDIDNDVDILFVTVTDIENDCDNEADLDTVPTLLCTVDILKVRCRYYNRYCETTSP